MCVRLPVVQAYYRRALEADPCHVNILSNYGLFLAEVGRGSTTD